MQLSSKSGKVSITEFKTLELAVSCSKVESMAELAFILVLVIDKEVAKIKADLLVG